ncbi:MAG TPA: serine/threonine-protein kinase [Dokdonella sp.]|uniref:serine/threonine-protein kinase n=1 Tax=Dokdonella sp. TaxID=2291710 RepID=UPI0025C44395|nr:serine/threonine-protein kinase [Dokdonella sp.]MBX3690975.1 serine/threonine protein kinase [Dokdonella sp.]MCW5567469.1 serine/threonine protein kinase [Dokdonella sp.]HNR91851.1 serine/threonine-protein kinase [Dokdonella sp.]
MPNSDHWLRTGIALQGGIARDLFAESGARELAHGDRLGPFAITGELGRGGMAIVYAAERADGEFEQDVAIKWVAGLRVDEESAALFRRERQILALLRHPNIARLLDGGRTEDGMLWFAMERVDGLRLDHHLAAGHDAGFDARLALLRQVCAALAFAHGRGLVHRDIKPGNIAVDGDGTVKLLDFGIAQLAGQDSDNLRTAHTPAWASPEQQRGESTGAASDIYQLGLLLQWLCSDATGAPNGLRSRELEAIIDRACAATPETRYESVASSERDLIAWQQRRPLNAFAGGSGYRLRLFLRRHTLAAAAAIAALLVLVTLSAGFAWRLKQERDFAVTQAHRADAAREFLVSLFRGADPMARKGLNLTARDLLDRGEARIDTELAGEPELRADLQETLGSVYLYLAEYERAETLVQASLDGTPDDAGDPRRTLDRVRRTLLLGSVYNRSRQSAKALEQSDAALALLATLTGPEALEHELSAMNARAMSFKNLGRSEDAAQALQHLLARVDASPEAQRHRAYAADNLAHVHQSRGRWHDALVQAGVAEQAFLDLRGPDHPEPWAVARFRASLELATGDLASARGRFEKVLAAQQRIHDPGDRRIMNTRTGLASVALQQDDIAGARPLLDEALAECRQLFGDDRSQCAVTWQLHGERLLADGDVDAALPVLREALSLHERATTPSHRTIGLAQLALAAALCQNTAIDEGRALLADARRELHVTPPAPLDLQRIDATGLLCHE